MKQTAVEWLINQMKQRESQGLTLSMYELEMFGEQAKAMEKEQIENVFDIVWKRANETKYKFYTTAEDNGFNYYNETFKSVKHNTDIRSMDKLIESNKKFDENNLKGFKYDPNDRSEDTPDITNFFY